MNTPNESAPRIKISLEPRIFSIYENPYGEGHCTRIDHATGYESRFEVRFLVTSDEILSPDIPGELRRIADDFPRFEYEFKEFLGQQKDRMRKAYDAARAALGQCSSPEVAELLRDLARNLQEREDIPY